MQAGGEATSGVIVFMDASEEADDEAESDTAM